MGLFDGSNSSTTTSSGVPSWAQPTYQAYLGRAQQVSDLPYNPYTGQRVAGFTDAQQQAQQATVNRAMQGNDAMNAGSQALTSMASGADLGQQAAQNPYLNAQNPYAQSGNPYLSQNIDSAMQDVTRNYNLAVRPQMDAMDARSGSFGNSGVQQMHGEQQRQFGQTLGNMANSMRSADYNQRAQLNENATNRQFTGGQAMADAQNSMYNAERGRQMQAIGFAPTYAQNDYADIAAMGGIGAQQQQQQQQGLDTQYQQFQEARQYPQQQLSTLGGALGVNVGTQSTSTTNPGSPSTAGQLAGWYALMNGMSGNGNGSSSGSGLGSLLGIFGG